MDSTESIRREIIATTPTESIRTDCEAEYGQVWDTDELGRDFDVRGFSAPFVYVVRKSDGKKGSLQFQHSPRFYHSWEEKA